MEFFIKPMNRDAAISISSWAYDAPYDFYNPGNREEVLNEFLDGTYFMVLDKAQDVVGFCCHGYSARVPIGIQYGAYPEDGSLDVGLGMRPDLTGQGNGHPFVNTILAFMESGFGTQFIRLTVARFNSRAIRLYERLGFVTTTMFARDTVEFVTMASMNDSPAVRG